MVGTEEGDEKECAEEKSEEARSVMACENNGNVAAGNVSGARRIGTDPVYSFLGAPHCYIVDGGRSPRARIDSLHRLLDAFLSVQAGRLHCS